MMPHPAARPISPVDDASWDEGVDLRRYLAILIRRWRLIGLIVLVALGAGFLLSLRPPTLFEARAILQLSAQSDPLYAAPSSAIQVFSNLNFLTEVAGAAGGTESPSELRGAITASGIRDTLMVRIRVRHRDPARARDLAHVVADRFLRRGAARVAERERIVREQLEDVEEQLRRVDRLLALSQEAIARFQRARPDGGLDGSFALNAASISLELRDRLWASRNQLRRDLVDLQFPAMIEAPAAEATPLRRRTATTLALAGILGLVVGGTVALLLEVRTVRPPATAIPPGFTQDPGA